MRGVIIIIITVTRLKLHDSSMHEDRKQALVLICVSHAVKCCLTCQMRQTMNVECMDRQAALLEANNPFWTACGDNWRQLCKADK